MTNDDIDDFSRKLLASDAPISQRMALERAASDVTFPEVLEIDLETGCMRSISKQQLDAEMNAPSDQPRVFKVVATDGLQTKDGAA